MYEHFLTKKHCDSIIEDYRFVQIPSTSAKLKCGDIGMGCIANTSTIVEYVENGTTNDKAPYIKEKI